MGYQKLRPRGAIDFPMLSVAFGARVRGGVCEDAALVVGALAARPRVVAGMADLVKGKALEEPVIEAIAQAGYKQCRPVTNIPYDHDYRHEMVPVFVRRAVREALGLPPRAALAGAALVNRARSTVCVKRGPPRCGTRWRAGAPRAGAFALASVIESRGFTPRKPGVHMLIAEDGTPAARSAVGRSSKRWPAKRRRCSRAVARRS
jgi:xanthine/CO dehydrogenase XdhC/CoxF family maturation factor